MNLLALDTCDSRGSVSVLRDDQVLQTVEHDTADDYSLWLLPAIDRALQESGLTFADIDVYVAAAGPGSFTGVRVGLATVKAWAEVTGNPIVGVSRLEALATQAEPADGEFVAAFTNAQRKQLFGALYRSSNDGAGESTCEHLISGYCGVRGRRTAMGPAAPGRCVRRRTLPGARR